MYYKKLNWPTLDSEQHNELISLVKNSTNSKGIGIWGDFYHHYDLPESIRTWCKENLPITDDYQLVLQRFFNVESIPLHPDINRKENFIYLLSESGPVTRWQKQGVVLAEVCVPQYQWFSLDVGTPHEVLGLKDDRIAISIFKTVPINKKSL